MKAPRVLEEVEVPRKNCLRSDELAVEIKNHPIYPPGN